VACNPQVFCLHFTSIIEQCSRGNGQLKMKKNIMNIKTETMHNITGSLASELNSGRPSVRSVVIAALALWFGLVFFLGAQGAFVTNPASPPLPIFLGLA